MLTYQDIQNASRQLTIKLAQRACTLKKVAHAFINHYRDAFQFEALTLNENNCFASLEITTHRQEGNALIPCALGSLHLDDTHSLCFVLKTIFNETHSIDMPVRLQLDGEYVSIALINSQMPFIIPLEPIEGKFSDVVSAVQTHLMTIMPPT
ncbi:hypothetical protein [Providencia manganoxydans]|uniref:hypothetical protein n=1 Tax=Providencia manganoxydans TaxID=2923283 RepID=UPI0034E5EDF4